MWFVRRSTPPVARGAALPDLVVVGVALTTGLLAGVTVDVLAWVVARYGPQGDGWSFRGNGALVVPFGLGPAVLAGAWTALVLHYRAAERWLPLGLGAGLVGAAPVTASVAALVLFGAAGFGVSNGMTFLILAWIVVAPALAAALSRTLVGNEGPSKRAPLAHAIAGVVFPVALAAGFFAAEVVLPPGS